MKLETTKSFILAVLIGISLMLTYGLWSYQPNFDPLSKTPLVNEVDIGGKEIMKKDIIEPSSIIYHTNNDHYGFSDPANQSYVFRNMQSWVMDDFETQEVEGNRKAKNYEVEVIFPSPIPMDLVGNIFTFNEDVILPSWSFQRMYFTFESAKASLKVQFISDNGDQQATAVINNSKNYEKLWSGVSSLDGMRKYTLFNEARTPIYVPAEKMDLTKRSLTVSPIDASQFVNALFKNPSVVTRPNVGAQNDNGETYYSDSQRQMKVFQEGKGMEFINPFTSENNQMDVVNLLDRSITNINEHKGWTGDYRLLDIDANTHVVHYQMYSKGYPVYSSSNLSVIEQQWRNQLLTKYQRSLFQFGDLLESVQVDLPSGNDVVNYLKSKSNTNYKLENIKDIQLGYKLDYMNDNSYIMLEPAWYMNYNNNWIEIKFEDLANKKGGD